MLYWTNIFTMIQTISFKADLSKKEAMKLAEADQTGELYPQMGVILMMGKKKNGWRKLDKNSGPVVNFKKQVLRASPARSLSSGLLFQHRDSSSKKLWRDEAYPFMQQAPLWITTHMQRLHTWLC